MHAERNDAGKHPETELHGDLQAFCGRALSPDDPSLEARDRRGRPADSQTPATNPKDVGRGRNTQAE